MRIARVWMLTGFAVSPALMLVPVSPASAVSLTLAWSLGMNVTIPRMLLGTGGGGGGYAAGAWLAAGGAGFDSAQTYCYTSSRPFCSHVAISNALASWAGAPPYIISKVEPEDFGTLEVMSGFGRVVDRGILQDLSLASLDMIMMHQAGRSAGASNVRPACYNASAGAEGTYAVCRLQAFATFLELVKKGVARAAAVSNWVIRDLQQVHAAFGVYPAALEIEVHPWWHEDELISFARSVNITLINYAPLALARPTALQDPTVVRIAGAHGVSSAAVLLQWGLQFTGGVVIPRSANATHMRENLAMLPGGSGAFTLSDSDMVALAQFPQKKIFNVYCQPEC